MDTRKSASEYRMAQWAQIMQGRVENGESIKEFCESAGISRNVYFYWQRKLRETACAELAQIGTESGKGNAPSGWARLEAAEAFSGETTGVTIETDWCKVGVTAETNPELLARVCRMLKSL